MFCSYPGDMSVSNAITAELRDPGLPAVPILLGRGVPLPLTTAFAHVGVVVEQATAVQVTWWPGKSIVVRYRAQCAGRLDGSHQIVACAGEIPDGATIVEGDGIRVGVWRLPHDPALPGLAAALDPRTAGLVVRGLGMPDDRLRTRLRAYRPGRRAVVELRGERTLLYLKLVRPPDVESLYKRHLALSAGSLVPPALGVDTDLGVLALRALPGITLRQALEDPAATLPEPQDIDALLDGIFLPRDVAPAPSPLEQLPALSKLLLRILPSEGGRIKELVDRIGRETQPLTVTVHGDFHEAQLLVKRGVLAGVLDIDTAGPGRTGDDPATMLGHLAVLEMSSTRPERVRAYGEALLRRWDRRTDPIDLRMRVAAVILGLATGPFRVQRERWPLEVRSRLGLAQCWLESIDKNCERNLIPASWTRHGCLPSLDLPHQH